MNLKNLIKSRRSIRKFKDIPISSSDLKELIEAGIYAPTGANTQCYRFVVTTNAEDIAYMGKVRTKYFRTCKAIIFCFADWSACWNNYPEKSKYYPNLPYWDCGASMQNIILMAEAKKIGSCWISMSPQMKCMDYINQTFNIPETYEIMGAIALGYPNEEVNYEKDLHQRRPIKRKSLDFYIHNWKE
jgi:nitroreductase